MTLPYFDITKQLPQDLMHVMLEGVIPLHIEEFLNYFIHDANILTLSQINSRLMAYPYAYFEEKPMPLNERDFAGSQSGEMYVIGCMNEHSEQSHTHPGQENLDL